MGPSTRKQSLARVVRAGLVGAAVAGLVSGGLGAFVTICWLAVVGLVGVASFLDRDAAEAIGGIGVTIAAGVVASASNCARNRRVPGESGIVASAG